MCSETALSKESAEPKTLKAHTACGILRNFAYTHRKIANYATVERSAKREIKPSPVGEGGPLAVDEVFASHL